MGKGNTNFLIQTQQKTATVRPDEFLSIIPRALRSALWDVRRGDHSTPIPKELIDSTEVYAHSPVPICIAVNSHGYHSEIARNGHCRFYRYFVDNLEAQTHTNGTKDMHVYYMKQNAITFILLLCISKSPDVLAEYIKEATPSQARLNQTCGRKHEVFFRNEFVYMANEFMQALRADMTAHLSNTDTRTRFFFDILYLFDLILQDSESEFVSALCTSIAEVTHMPSFWPVSFKMRTCLLSYMEDGAMVFRRMMALVPRQPKLVAIDTERKNKHMEYDVLIEYFRYLPVLSTELDPKSPIAKFAALLYQKDLLKYAPDNNTLLRQMLVYCMLNWEELWHKMGWPRFPSFRNRLAYMKHKRVFTLDPTETVRLMYFS